MTRTHHPAPAATTATATAATVGTTATATAATVSTAATARGAARSPDAVVPRHLVSGGGPLLFGRMDRAGGRVGGVQ